MKGLPPPAPPYTRGETDARNRINVSMLRILPLCKIQMGRIEAPEGWIKVIE